jgi:hypothetical protein
MSSELTVTRSRKNSRLSKPLNLRHFLESGTHLAANRNKNVRMTQPPLRESILDHSFRYTRSIDTDLSTGAANMKLNTILTNKLALLSAAFCAVMLAFSTNASALIIGDAHELGFVNFGVPSGDADRTTYVNHLIDMALGTSDVADGQTYTRSNNDFGPLPTAVFGLNGTGTSIDLGAGLYSYLFAKYDGPNYGSEVWYVGDLSGIITIPATGGQYGLSGWTLFTGDDPPRLQVPEGGSTLIFVGIALGVLVIARRYRRRTIECNY